MPGKRFEIDAIFRAIDQITDPVRKMSRSVGRAAGRMAHKLGKVRKVLDGIGGAAKRAGQMGLGASVVLAGGLARVVKTGAEVEETLVKAGEKLGGIARDTAAFEALEKAAGDMAISTEFKTNSASKALFFMGTAGESAAVAMGTLKTMADGATSGSTDLSRAANIASDAIGILGLDLDSTGKKLGDTEKIAAYAKTMDLLTSAHGAANLNIEDVFETVKKSGKIYTESGQSLETYFALMQGISGSIKNSQAGTAMKIILTNILATTGESSKAFKRLRNAAGKRIKLTTDTGAIRQLPDILREVNEGMARYSKLRASQQKTLLFGKEAVATGSAMLSNLDDIDNRVIAMGKHMGSSRIQAAKFRDTTMGAFKSFGSTVEAIEIHIFKEIGADIEKLTKQGTAWARANKAAFGDAVSQALKFMKDNFDDFVRIAPRVLKFIAALWGLSKVLAVINTVLTITAGLTTVTAATLGIVAASVIAVIAVLALMVVYWDEIAEVMEVVGDYLVDTFIQALDLLTFGYHSLIEGVKSGDPVWSAVIATLALVLAPITLLIGSWALLKKAWGPAPLSFKKLWVEIVDSFTRGIESITKKIDAAKNMVNDLFGTQIFEADMRLRPHVEKINDVRMMNLTNDQRAAMGRNALGDDLRGNNPTLGQLGFGSSNPPPAPVSPEIIDTRREFWASTTEESKKETVDVNVNVKAAPGTVDSVEKKGKGTGVNVTSSGDL